MLLSVFVNGAVPGITTSADHKEQFDDLDVSRRQKHRMIHPPLDRSLIIGGEDTADGRFSFAEVSLELSSDHQCGGTLVAEDFLLTAAHCQDWVKKASVFRHDFENNLDEYQTFELTTKIIHPGFEKVTFENDFMLLPIGTVSGALPVVLNDNPNIPSSGEELTILGWGATDISVNPSKPEFPSVLQMGSVNYIDNDSCEAATVRGKQLYRNEIFSEMICASSPGVDACSGDSGGPLIIKGEREGLDLQVGIVSWGRGCALYPGVYSRVSSGYPWIRSHICWSSRNPPAYMKCADSERSPEFIQEAPTLSPVDQPKDSSSHTGKSQNEGKRDTTDRSQSSKPTESTNTDDTRIYVYIEIQLDGRSEDISWFLEENGQKVIDLPFDTYATTPNQIVRATALVEMGSTLTFSITDRIGDGMCCSYGRNGWYRISMSKGTGSSVTVVEADGAFGRRSSLEFSADVGSAPDGSLYLLGPVPQPVTSGDEGETQAGAESPTVPGGLLTVGLEDYSRSFAVTNLPGAGFMLVPLLALTIGWFL